MTPEELATTLEAKALAAVEKLNKIVFSTQNKAYGDVVITLKKLALDKEGYIIQSADNRAVIREANRAFARALERAGYVDGLNTFTVAFSAVDEINGQYFQGFDGFNPNRQFMKAMQKQVLQDIERLLLNEGLEAQIKLPLSQLLTQNINTGGSYQGLLEQVKNYIQGTPDADGKLLRHVKTITKDLLFNYSRAYQQAVASDLNLEFYLYVGGIIRTSRDWCREKAGNFFHQKEIEAWADEDWAGKRADTTKSSIFIYAGGHGCLHQILPVSLAVVPVDVVDRARKAGYLQSKKATVEAVA